MTGHDVVGKTHFLLWIQIVTKICQHLAHNPHGEGTVARRSAMHVHDAAANLPPAICITEVFRALLNAFLKKIAWLHWHQECEMQIFRTCVGIATHSWLRRKILGTKRVRTYFLSVANIFKIAGAWCCKQMLPHVNILSQVQTVDAVSLNSRQKMLRACHICRTYKNDSVYIYIYDI
jgi:hypothetical protein